MVCVPMPNHKANRSRNLPRRHSKGLGQNLHSFLILSTLLQQFWNGKNKFKLGWPGPVDTKLS